jgi:hypothetical protein
MVGRQPTRNKLLCGSGFNLKIDSVVNELRLISLAKK